MLRSLYLSMVGRVNTVGESGNNRSIHVQMISGHIMSVFFKWQHAACFMNPLML